MEKRTKLLISLVFVLVLLLIIYDNLFPPKNKVCFDENCFYVELAITNAQRMEGLKYRESLSQDRGMLFVFNKRGIYSFWMNKTFIPLDIIWIDEDLEVVFIKESALPCTNSEEICETFNPNREARYVLEINSGISKEISLNLGDEVKFYLK